MGKSSISGFSSMPSLITGGHGKIVEATKTSNSATHLSTSPLAIILILKSHHSNLPITFLFPKRKRPKNRQAAFRNDPVNAHHDLLGDVFILARSKILHDPPGFGQLGLHRDLRIHLRWKGIGQNGQGKENPKVSLSYCFIISGWWFQSL